MTKSLAPAAASADAILERYGDTVLRLCLVYLRSRSDAEDAFQTVFMKLCEKKPCFREEEHVKAWLITVTHNVCLSELRSFWKRRVVCVEETAAPVREEDRDVVRAVLGLPLKYREAAYLHYFEGYKVAETASLLHCRETTVKTRLFRARALLKHELSPGGNEYDG